ncbi:trypsin II-P29-like [Amphibalanus amphitrite]|uniref:trypsin II-P29-like n=1 Tax=Amphibalanus amphitrite TaxID=1232801 RepID=UPI001C9076E6|nr:trypsin II-P29-like [Amphibalanus amphitrite]
MSFSVVTCCLLVSFVLAAAGSPAGKATQPAGDQPHLEPYKPRTNNGASMAPLDAQPLPLSAEVQNSETVPLAAGRYYIQSTNYPQLYPNSFDFTYPTFTGADGQQLRIYCPHLDIEPHSDCAYDWLSINGTRFCGAGSVSERRALSLSIEFHSDYIVRHTGYLCYIEVPALSCCGRALRHSRIVGGVPTEEHEYPWQAGVVYTGSNRTWCGGSLINSRYVLTAAHCVASAEPHRIEVLLGDHWIGQPDAGELRFSVERITVHPNYTSFTGGDDFALLRLASAVPISAEMSPVCLPPADETFAGMNATATGFGRTASNESQSLVLREVQLPIWSPAQCAGHLATLDTTSMVCAGGVAGQATCSGDSGGPLVAELAGRFTLVGATSFGYVPCGLRGYPSVYSRVTSALTWIENTTADASLCG